eukprot:scaffold82863_cov31-Tisochrysis_lutea.AAC.5
MQGARWLEEQWQRGCHLPLRHAEEQNEPLGLLLPCKLKVMLKNSVEAHARDLAHLRCHRHLALSPILLQHGDASEPEGERTAPGQGCVLTETVWVAGPKAALRAGDCAAMDRARASAPRPRERLARRHATALSVGRSHLPLRPARQVGPPHSRAGRSLGDGTPWREPTSPPRLPQRRICRAPGKPRRRSASAAARRALEEAGGSRGRQGAAARKARESLILVLRDRASSATEPQPCDGSVRGWCMARPVYVARDAS